MSRKTPNRVDIIVPERAPTNSGNSVTAQRYSDLLSDSGFDVKIVPASRGTARNSSVLIALNAYRCESAIQRAACGASMIVVLTGTDVYQYLESQSQVVLSSLRRADAIVSLNDQASRHLPTEFHERHQTIIQSAPTLVRSARDPDEFRVIVVGHLRDVKDPLRTADACRALPSTSRIRVHHYGDAYNEEWRQRALAESESNPRYHWHGAVDRKMLGEIYSTADAMVISSRLEGGANVISECVMADVPVLASRIPGNIGLLGEGYLGYFPVADSSALRELLVRCEHDDLFLAELSQQIRSLRPRFSREFERASWIKLLNALR